ncbi:DivIVA domain-containing protein [Marinilongibacter aquaticus]|uniref:DivIVA domain-containing protein n=1 Tax=Marinilongibacter aquaticus TaxID=2975157 RepID=UPI0021BD335F|nr:DivIVA domain-containing protein [Marinilongibacter aquaticus]UBM58308.1 DivIVA domain-containing protein [Marinilongibacter aquaticus]
MKITSQEIKQHEFEKAFRGYNIEEVDIFLNNLANEWERTSTESKMLRMQLEIAEKEATKLREVEMSLIKTLQTAEDTSTKIAEHAKKEAETTLVKAAEEADNQLSTAKAEANRIVEEAEAQARRILIDAENQVTEAQKAIIEKEKSLRVDITNLEEHKKGLIAQLRALSAATIEKLELYGSSDFQAEIESSTALAEEYTTENETDIVEEEITAIASSANTLALEEEESKGEIDSKDNDLTIIEGIGPKIAELLHAHEIESFRDLITTPVYKLKDILNEAGSHFAMHDPSTWAEQARLAEDGQWEKLDVLKDQLQGGRKVEEEKAEAGKTAEQNTEEMLDRVNKVKAALKKAMVNKDKGENASISGEKPEESSSSGGSFFDNI